MTLTLTLRRTDQGGFERSLAEVEDRDSPLFRHFLTQRELADRFGPSLNTYDMVLRWLRSEGFALVQGSANRLTITVRGTQASAERAFDVAIGNYASSAGKAFYANTDAPALPAQLAGSVESVNGLSDMGRPQVPQLQPLECKGILALQGEDDAPCQGFSNHNPGPPTLPAPPVGDVDNDGPPYNASDPSLASQKVGLLEFDTFHPGDVSDFLSFVGLDPSLITNLSEVPVAGGVSAPGAGETEVLADIDAVFAQAPGAPVVVYDAPQGTSFTTLFNAMISDGDTVISNSWSACEDQVSEAEAQSIDQVLQSAAAAGISVLNASGDHGSTCGGAADTVGVPADSPSATAVGGSSLSTGAGDTYGSEKWWDGSASIPQTGQGGFGVSAYFPRPAYQADESTSAGRSLPDVVVNADPAHGYIVCQADAGGCPTGEMYGGTSIASPVWAGFVALLNARQGHNLGALNPAFYPLAATTAFHSAASMGSDFAHVGLGSPNLDALSLAASGTAAGAVSSAGSDVYDTAGGFVHGSGSDDIIALLRDADGNSVSGKQVSLTASSASVTISPSSGESSVANGASVFQVSDSAVESVTFTATDTDDNVTVGSLTVDFTPAVADGSSIAASPTLVADDGSSQAKLTVNVENSVGEPASGKTVSLGQGGGNAVITPVGSSTPGTTAVTDSNGDATFSATDANAESIDFTAIDVTDGNLPVPGSVVVNFTSGGATCDTALPTAASGQSVSSFATGLAYDTAPIVYPGNFTEAACSTFEGAPAFDTSGNAYVPDAADGTIHVFGPSGGAPSTENQLPDTSFPGGSLGQLAFGPDGSLYAGLIQTSGSVSNPEIVQLDPATGATLRVVADKAAALPDCPFVLVTDPLSGDLFTDDECNGYAASNQISRIHDPSGPSPTVSNYVTTGGCNLGMSFAPDGTLYLANCTGEVDEIGGTNTTNPAPTQVAAISSGSPFAVAVRAVSAAGHATALDVFTNQGSVTTVDLTNTPATTTPAAAGTSHFFLTAVGADGCGYGTIPGTIVRVGPAACSSSTSTTSGPQLTLQESSGSAAPPTGSSVGFTAELRNVSSPSGTPIYFNVAGPNSSGKLANASSAGQATASYVGALRGVDTVTASAVVNGKTIRSAPLLVHWVPGKATTFLDLNASEQGGAAGQPTTVTASLLDLTTSPLAVLGGETVTLGLGGQTCQAQTSSSGVASCRLTPPSPGLMDLSASFAGSSSYTPTSSTTLFDATMPSGRSTSTTLSCSPSSVPDGTTTVCTARVSDAATGTPSTPTGAVSFSSDSPGAFGPPGNSCTLAGSGSTAACQVDYTPSAVGSGTHTITAAYGGDGVHAGGGGSTTLTVTSSPGGGGLAATMTLLSSSANPAVTGQHLIYTVTVTPAPNGGSVRVLDDGKQLPSCGTVPLNASTGTAHCAAMIATPGSSRIQAVYTGDGEYAGSQSPTVVEKVRSSVTLKGEPSGRHGRVTVYLRCARRSSDCHVTVRLATVEIFRGKRLVALVARVGRHRHQRTIGVGSTTVVTAAGETATVTTWPNRAGRRLLAAFGRLPVLEGITLTVHRQHSRVATRRLVVGPAAHKTRAHRTG